MSDSLAADVAAGLARVSEDIKREVGQLIPVAAQQMASILTGRYPISTIAHPHMRDQVRVSTGQASDALPISRVKAPNLATIWQDGTVQRHDATRANANRGRMPAAAHGFFERTAVQTRAAMLQRAQTILDKPREVGTISGGAGSSLL
jgi:hypothetical protein